MAIHPASSNGITTPGSRNARGGGFALALILSLLGFLMLLVATLATYLRIETQTSFNHHQWSVARQHALMGLNIGLGQLQQLAGPDQRVTATGKMLEDKYGLRDGRMHWTGVWDASGGNFLGWLTSDAINDSSESLITRGAPDPDVSEQSVWLVNRAVKPKGISSEVWDEAKIAIRKRPIRSTSLPGLAPDEEKVTGNFAYWISDEGVKASALKMETDLPNSLTPLQESRILQVINRETELDHWFNRLQVNDKATRDSLQHTFSFNQLEALDGISRDGLLEYFHRLTPVSLGVLANTLPGRRGGLKKDLSQFHLVSDTTLPIGEGVIHFLRHRPSSEDFLTLRGVSGGATGDPVFSIPLIATELSLRIGFSLPENGDGPVDLHWSLRTDLWNSASLPIQSTPRDVSDLILKIEGLPTLSLTYWTVPGTPANPRAKYTIDLQNAGMDEVPIDLDRHMAAGEVRHNLQTGRNAVRAEFIDSTPGDSGDDRFTIEGPGSLVTFRLMTRTGELLQEFIDIPYAPLQTDILESRDLSHETGDGDTEMLLRFWFRFQDEQSVIGANGLGELERWSTEVDPRGPTFTFDHPLIEFDPEVYSGRNANDFSDRPEFFFGGGKGRPGGSHFRFFDLPTLEPVSIASLRHLNFSGVGPNYLGNPGARENLVFDELYFSTLPSDPAEADRLLSMATAGLYRRPFLNPHILIWGDVRGADLVGSRKMAQHSLLFGAFNLNCVSADAWEMILSGNDRENWKFRILEDGRTPKTRDVLENPFFRLPFGADRHDAYPTDQRRDYPHPKANAWWKSGLQPEQPAWAAAHAVGMREFSDQQIRELAEAIARINREQGRPATSMADFIDRGILQKAIDRTSINTIDESPYTEATRASRIPRNAPAFLNQADILNTIAPFLQVRSDTFRIRAYGEAINPVTGKLEGRAWCEAWVQRVPELVESGSDIEISATGMGRKFIIRHFKWLDESQI